MEAPRLHVGAAMYPAEDFYELPVTERPTIPVPEPRESGVRLKVTRVAYGAATVDVVLCDLSRDPRSESYADQSENPPSQNERPPSTSIVRALK